MGLKPLDKMNHISFLLDRIVEYLNNYLTIAYNPQNLQRETVDCNKFRPLEFGDAIATLTNKTKPTELTRLGGFVICIENLSTH